LILKSDPGFSARIMLKPKIRPGGNVRMNRMIPQAAFHGSNAQETAVD